MTGGLSKFDDKPENYLSWKATFQSTIDDLGLTASEEINLLIKWLGPKSSEHAKRVKAVNIRHPSVGLNMIWTRLQECYGSAEAIEQSFFTRIDNFPKLSSKEPHKLRELSDLISELEVARLDGYLPGLSYYDTAKGINPIVAKLPFNLQDKWREVGSRFKEQHRVAFPPFFVFCEFLRKEARTRNDPSFAIDLSSSVSKSERRPSDNNTRPSVTVHKTDVSADEESGPEDLSRQCPIHHRPHPLKRCREFRTMLLEDRKKFIKNNDICFRCLASTSHQAKDCSITIKCVECGSERHLAALHPGPPSQTLGSPSSPQEHGGETSSSED